jgi:predicted AlkP superfamily phosphohydrolase/phosphomutase
MSSQRIVLIGLDGVPYGLIRDLAHNSTMPHMGSLIARGLFCPLASSIPEISSVAWSSIITGANPAEHGIFGFIDLAPGTYRRIFPNFASLQVPPFWTRPEFGRAAILNVPSTYPARPLDGCMVAGFVALDLEKAVYPPELVPQLEALDYRVDVDAGRATQSMRLFLADLGRTLQARVAAYRYLWQSERWDTFMLVFTGTDRLAHYLWHAYENAGHRYHQAFLDHFHHIDAAIGEIAAQLDADDLLILLSDHGFERLTKEVYVNHVLAESGLLSFPGAGPARLARVDRMARAFALDPGRIYLHEQGRYPRGSVSPADREPLLREIEALFQALEIDGQKVIRRAYRRDEIYHGPWLERAPDLVLLAEPGYNLRATLRPGRLWDRGQRSGKHTQDDAFLLVCGHPEPETVPGTPCVEDVVPVMRRAIQAHRS